MGRKKYWILTSTVIITTYYETQLQEEDAVYMIGLPKFTDSSKNIELSEAMKSKAVYDELQNAFLFRVTEDQWEELTEAFFEARELADENIEEVRFTYEELFSTISTKHYGYGNAADNVNRLT